MVSTLIFVILVFILITFTLDIWIITDGKDTGVGKIVEEFPKYKEKSKIHVFHKVSKTITKHEVRQDEI